MRLTPDGLDVTKLSRILLTVDETAHACGLAPGTLRTRLSRKTFPVAHRKVGDKTLFHIEAVAKFIDGLPSVGPRGRGLPRKLETMAIASSLMSRS